MTQENPSINSHRGALYIDLSFSWTKDAVASIIDQVDLDFDKSEMDVLRYGFQYDSEFTPPRRGNLIMDHSATRIRCHDEISKIRIILSKLLNAFQQINSSLDNHVNNYYFKFEFFPINIDWNKVIQNVPENPIIAAVSQHLDSKLIPSRLAARTSLIATKIGYFSMDLSASSYNPSKIALLKIVLNKEKGDEIIQFIDELPNLIQTIESSIG